MQKVVRCEGPCGTRVSPGCHWVFTGLSQRCHRVFTRFLTGGFHRAPPVTRPATWRSFDRVVTGLSPGCTGVLTGGFYRAAFQQHGPPPGGVLDGRAGAGLQRPRRCDGLRRGLPEALPQPRADALLRGVPPRPVRCAHRADLRPAAQRAAALWPAALRAAALRAAAWGAPMGGSPSDDDGITIR